MRAVELLLSLHELLLLVGEVDELVEGLLVDVTVLLELLVTVVELLKQLLYTQVLVLLESITGKGTQLTDLPHALVFLLRRNYGN